jgi:hypothetical protein
VVQLFEYNLNSLLLINTLARPRLINISKWFKNTRCQSTKLKCPWISSKDKKLWIIRTETSSSYGLGIKQDSHLLHVCNRMIVFIIFVVFSTVLDIQSARGFFLFFFFRVRLLDLLLGYALLQVWLPGYLNFFVFQLLVSSNISLSTLLLISNIHLLELFNTILSSILTSCWNFIWDKAW